MKQKISLLILVFHSLLLQVNSQCITCTSSNSINNGLVWCHPFSGNALDVTGNGYNGVVSNATLTNDRFNNPNSAYFFNGVNSYIDIVKNLPDLDTFSFSFWYKPLNPSSVPYSYLFWEGNSICGSDILMILNSTNFTVMANKNGALLNSNVNIPVVISTNWVHVVWVMAKSQSRFYVNGNLFATINQTGSGVGEHFTPTYGCSNDGGGPPCGSARSGFYNGSLDDVRLYNRTLTLAEIQLLYNLNTDITLAMPSPQSICAGDSVSLNPISNGTAFSWQPSAVFSNSSVKNTKASPSNTQYLKLTATNVGCTKTDSVLVTVNTVNLTMPTAQQSCLGDSLLLSPTSNGNSFSWQPANLFASPTSAISKVKPNTTQFFRLTATANGCSKTDSVLVTVNTVNLTMPSGSMVCKDDSVLLNITTDANSINWTPSSKVASPGNTSTKVFADSSRYYKVLVGKNGCSKVDSVLVQAITVTANAGNDVNLCLKDTIRLNATGGGSYLWSPGNFLSDSTVANPLVQPATSQRYVLKTTVGSCNAYDTIDINVTQIAVNAGKDTSLCNGDTINLYATSIGAQLKWLVNNNMSNDTIGNPFVWPQNTTNYILRVTEGSCVVYDTVNVNVFATVPVVILGAGRICTGDTVQLIASGGAGYEWITDYAIDNRFISSPRVYPERDTVYKLIATQGNCKGVDSILIKVDAKPLVDAGLPFAICIGNTAQLNGTSSGAMFTYWQPSNLVSDSLDLQASVSANISSWLKLIAVNGMCTASDSVRVVVSQGVTASFSADPTEGYAPLKVNFANSSSSNATVFKWSNGNGGAFNSVNIPTQTYNDSGFYLVYLIVKDSAGCQDSVATFIRVRTEEGLRMPNVFTPNGDNLNDFFGVAYNEADFEYVKLFTYSRWGELLHTAYMPGGAWWDGTYKGSECPTGVYFFILEARSKSGKMYNYRGTVTLLK